MNDGAENSNANGEVIVVLPGGAKLPLTRRSIATGEFWLVALIVGALIWLEWIGRIPPTLATVAQVVMGLGVTWLRTHAKAVGGEQVVDAIEAAKTLPPEMVRVIDGAKAAVAAAKTDVPGGAPATTGGAPVLPIAIALLAAGALVSCTSVKENGKTVFRTSANARHVDFKSAGGSRLVMDDMDHATVHKAIGSSVANGAAGVGAGVATSGLLGIFH